MFSRKQMARAIIYSWPYMLEKSSSRYKIWSIQKTGDALLNVCRGWGVDAVYVTPCFTWKRLCGILRTYLISPAWSLWYLDQSYISSGHHNEERWVQIVSSGVHKVLEQWYSTETEDELQAIPCLGFYTWAYSAQHRSVSERHCGCRACAVLLLHNCLLTSNLKTQRNIELYKS